MDIFKEYDPGLFAVKRRVVGVSTTELSDICHISRQTLHSVETGKSGSWCTITIIGMALDGLASRNIDHVKVFEILEQSSNSGRE